MKRLWSAALLASALLLGACASPYDPNSAATVAGQLEQSRVDFGKTEFSENYRRHYERYLEIHTVVHGTSTAPVSSSLVTSTSQLAEYTSAGYAYVDRKCGEYFHLLHRFYKRKRESVNTANLATGLLSGLGAATKAKAAEIAVVAVGGSSASAFIDNSGSSLLFELDPSSSQGITLKALAKFRKETAGEPVLGLSDAVTAIQNYAAICTPSYIERLVKEAVDSAPLADTANGSAPAPDPLAGVRALVASALGVASVSDNEVAALYWLFELKGKDTAADRDAIAKQLQADTAAALFQGGALKSGAPALEQQARTAAAVRAMAAFDPKVASRADALKKGQKAETSSADTAGGEGPGKKSLLLPGPRRFVPAVIGVQRQ